MKIIFKCGKCELDIEDESQLDMHMKPDHILSCGECDFNLRNTQELKDHMDNVHSNICEKCNLEFQSKKKLSDHMCRIHVLNPTCGDSYMKNLTIFESCTRIFSRSLITEVIYVHSQQCIDKMKSCSDMLASYKSDIFNYDGEIWHAPLSDFCQREK